MKKSKYETDKKSSGRCVVLNTENSNDGNSNGKRVYLMTFKPNGCFFFGAVAAGKGEKKIERCVSCALGVIQTLSIEYTKEQKRKRKREYTKKLNERQEGGNRIKRKIQGKKRVKEKGNR